MKPRLSLSGSGGAPKTVRPRTWTSTGKTGFPDATRLRRNQKPPAAAIMPASSPRRLRTHAADLPPVAEPTAQTPTTTATLVTPYHLVPKERPRARPARVSSEVRPVRAPRSRKRQPAPKADSITASGITSWRAGSITTGIARKSAATVVPIGREAPSSVAIA